MGVSSVIQQTFNFIDVKMYYKNSWIINTSIIAKAGTFLYAVFTCGEANSKHAMLMNGVSVEISQ